MMIDGIRSISNDTLETYKKSFAFLEENTKLDKEQIIGISTGIAKLSTDNHIAELTGNGNAASTASGLKIEGQLFEERILLSKVPPDQDDTNESDE